MHFVEYNENVTTLQFLSFQAVEWSDWGWAGVKCGEVGQQFLCYLHHVFFYVFPLYFFFLLHQVTLPWSSLSAHSWRSQNQVVYLLVRWPSGQVARWQCDQVVKWSCSLIVRCRYETSLNFVLPGAGSGKDGKKSDNLHGWQNQTVLKAHHVAGRTAWIKLYLYSYNCVVGVPIHFSWSIVKFRSWSRVNELKFSTWKILWYFWRGQDQTRPR